MTTKLAQLTPAELAYQQFSSQPLARLAGVDRASFIAGYDTAMETSDRLRAVNEELVRVLQRIADSQPAERHYEYTVGIARAALISAKN